MKQNENITAEGFFRGKLKEINPAQAIITLANELISAEQGMRWAKEFSDQQKNPLQDNIDLLKNEVETWQNSYNRVYDKYRKCKTEAKELKSKIDEIKKDNEWIYLPTNVFLKNGLYIFLTRHPETKKEGNVLHEVTNGLHGFSYAYKCKLID